MKFSNKAVFLDRDGVINIDFGYVHKWEDFHIYEGVVDALKIFKSLDFKLIIITNQSGIDRKLFKLIDYEKLTKQYVNFFKSKQIIFDGIYFCPHHPDFSEKKFINCECRKPNPGLFIKSGLEHKINFENSIAIGDNLRDLEAAERVGIKKRFLIQNSKKNTLKTNGIMVYKSLLKCAEFIENENKLISQE